MLRNFIFIFFVFVYLVQPSFASDAPLAKVQNPQIVGAGVLSYAFWDVYRATLYAPEGQWSYEEPFVLSIQYFRNLKGAAIADRSVQEMRAQGFRDEVVLAAWHAQMRSIFPDVQNGTILSAVYIPGQQTIFYRGNEKIGAIREDLFGRRFFGIWLDGKTSAPNLRLALLGVK